MALEPTHIDVKKDRGVTIAWSDGASSYYSVALLRRQSPSADMRDLREKIASNPLTVLPASAARAAGPLTITRAELVGSYAIKFYFSDGHHTGIYTWEYLRQLDPALQPSPSPAPDAPAKARDDAP